MRLGGRLAAAIEVLDEMEARKRPLSVSLRDWGNNHRFAGSGDRSAIGNLAYDALRLASSSAYLAGEDSSASKVFGGVLRLQGVTPDQLKAALEGDKFAPELPSDDVLEKLHKADLALADTHVQADIPEWLVPSFEANFADEWISEAQAFASRPPLDMRANTLKSTREKVGKALPGAKHTDIARNGLRIAPVRGDRRHPNVMAEAAYQQGKFEVQDQGSQIVADLVFAQPGEQVLDYCAGAGGKTLALAATMENRGQIHAWDADKTRLAPIHERLKRAGVRNAQVHDAAREPTELYGRFDRVVVDAPCSGSGTWRRRPDTKWKLTPEQLEVRVEEQEAVLAAARDYPKVGGFLIYITCSVLPEENENQVYAFVEANPEYELLSAGEVWQDLFGFDKRNPWSSDMKTITLTPASTGTDGFFFAVMERVK
ncbi:MAG: RsmB/NOP family class I SAM-dependent RNA methyltransferase [Pseudomonadota bacterium]